MRNTISRSFGVGSTPSAGRNGSGIESYHMSSCLCNSSQIVVAEEISLAEKSSEVVRLVDDKVKMVCFRG
jgi:hypothetical protein